MTTALLGNAIGGINQSASSAVAEALTASCRAARTSARDTTAAGGAGTTTTNAGSSEITSNDFLTLLVSELKNQDPTQPTDPNAYIQQLVGVNSLQQLIQINQEVATIAQPGTGSGTGSQVRGA